MKVAESGARRERKEEQLCPQDREGDQDEGTGIKTSSLSSAYCRHCNSSKVDFAGMRLKESVSRFFFDASSVRAPACERPSMAEIGR